MANKPQIDSSAIDIEQLEYDKHVNFYYSNLINSIILFALTLDELDKLAAPTFNPMSELETEIDYAFTPVCFETIFRNKLLDESFKAELLAFKKSTDDIPPEIWDWDHIEIHPTWVQIRQKANELLEKLGIESRTYNDDYTIVYIGDSGPST